MRAAGPVPEDNITAEEPDFFMDFSYGIYS